MFVNAHAIAKECTTALVRTWINRQDGDAAASGAGDIGECCGERTLPRPRCTGEPHDESIARVRGRGSECRLDSLIRCWTWALYRTDPLRQLATRREMLSVDGHSRAGR